MYAFFAVKLAPEPPVIDAPPFTKSDGVRLAVSVTDFASVISPSIINLLPYEIEIRLVLNILREAPTPILIVRL